MNLPEDAKRFKEKLGLKYFPIAYFRMQNKPENCLAFKNDNEGCVMPLIFSAAKGKTTMFGPGQAGWNCGRFYLGYRDSIFPGIEYFLSQGPFTREPEKLTKTARLAKKFIDAAKPENLVTDYSIFKPVEYLVENEKPLLITLFLNPDQASAVVSLLAFNDPLSERVKTRWGSACSTTVTIPLQYLEEGKEVALWGLFDITVRPKIPKELLTITMPHSLFREICENLDNSFVITERWEKIMKRNEK